RPAPPPARWPPAWHPTSGYISSFALRLPPRRSVRSSLARTGGRRRQRWIGAPCADRPRGFGPRQSGPSPGAPVAPHRSSPRLGTGFVIYMIVLITLIRESI